MFEPNTDDLNPNPLRGADPDLNFFSETTALATCEYFHESSFNQQFSADLPQLSLFHLNIRSIPKNFSSLDLYLSSLNLQFDARTCFK